MVRLAEKLITLDPRDEVRQTGETMAARKGGLDGKVLWKHQIEGPIRQILVLKKTIAFRNKAATLLLCGPEGRIKGEYRIHGSRSQFGLYKKDILELVPNGDMLSCFKVPTGDLVWRLPLAGRVQSMAVSEIANRMVILDSQSFHYHQLVHEPHAVEDRSSFLEL